MGFIIREVQVIMKKIKYLSVKEYIENLGRRTNDKLKYPVSIRIKYLSGNIFLYVYILAGYEFVTCGSAIKLQHASSLYRLHSHEVAYGAGSGQQVHVYIV